MSVARFSTNESARQVNRALALLAEAAFPPICVSCGEPLSLANGPPWLCDACRIELEPKSQVRCERCAAPVATPAPAEEGCPHCFGEPCQYDRTITWGDYHGPVRDAVLRMKRAFDEPLTSAVGELLAERVAEVADVWRLDVVLPVPMHFWRRLWRGTNSPDLLAQAVANRLRIPWSRRALRRLRATARQTTVPPGQRWSNVRGAFAVSRYVDWTELNVLLVDDVMTTGATCSELARCLKRAGAARVCVAVVCRATGEH